MKFNKTFSLILTVIMLLALPLSVQAGTVSGAGATLTVPDSFVSCTPSSMITTTGVGARTVHVWFFYHNPTTNVMEELGSAWLTGDVNLPFPYPAISGTMEFAARVDVYTSAGTFTKLEAQWTVTCTETPPPPPSGACSPGFWKNPDHFIYWVGYAPTDPYPGTSMTLLDALQGGKETAESRVIVAGWLNAANPTAPCSENSY